MTQTLQVVRHLNIERAEGGIISLSPTEKRVYSSTNWDTYLQMYKTHPTVRAAVDKIAKAATTSGYQFLPRDSTKPVNQKDVETLNLIFSRSKAISVLRQTYTDLLIFGDSFWHIVKSRNDAPYSFSRVSPKYVTLVFDSAINDVSQYIYRDPSTSVETAYPAEEFVHFRILDPDNDLFGLSLFESLKATVTQDLYAQTYNASFFENSAQTGIVFNMRGASADEIARNREFLRQEYVTPEKAHRPLLLEGDVKVEKSVASPAEMEFIKGREFLKGEILDVLDVPKSKMASQSDSANKSSSAEADKTFRVENIMPLQSIVEEGVNEQLLWVGLSIQETVFAHKDVDMRDEKERMEVDIEGMTHGIFTINDLRAQRGMGPVNGGDEPFIQTASGIVPVKDIANLLQMQQQQAQAQIDQAAAAKSAAETGQKKNTDGTNAPPVPNKKQQAQSNAPTGNQKKTG